MGLELLIEIGTEEIPSRFLPLALEQMQSLMTGQFSFHHIQHGSTQAMGTPRRLAICVQDVAESQTKRVIKAVGPPKRVAYDTSGKPTRAAIGFAQNHGVKVEDLKVEEIPEKGAYIIAEKEDTGKETLQLLPAIIPSWINSIGFPKSMRWGESDLKFVRPIHWIIAIFGGQRIPFSMDGIKSDVKTYGHRFLHPDPIIVKDFQSYMTQLEKACVICDPEKRREIILKQARAEAKKAGGTLREDMGLLDQVTNLVEWPVALCGSFDPKYLDLPEEVLVTSMRDNQKYFCIEDSKGRLLPNFVTISNMPADDLMIVIKGNERVLRARLSDASFFLDEDTKNPLSDRIESLKHVVFQEQLGSLHDKIIRIKELAIYMAEALEKPALDPTKKMALKNTLERSALLSKCDLVTEMVGEFPGLQGIMGREYATRSGEGEDVAQAIFEHYLPRFSGDKLPATLPGAILSLADKMDNLVGCFLLGFVPTGSEDPHALRRQTQGMIQIVLNNGLIFPWEGFIKKALSVYQPSFSDITGEIPLNLRSTKKNEGVQGGFPNETKGKMRIFLNQRLNNYFLAQGFDYDLINAVLDAGDAHPIYVQKRLEALAEFRSQEAFETILTPFKRVINILPKGGKELPDPDQRFFTEEAEKSLYDIFKGLEGELNKKIAGAEYLDALQAMVNLKESIDNFFDKVLVMDKDDILRNNRLSLLSSIGRVFLKIADFSRIVQSKE
ncbi:glycine--tRNA ligase subunit beta [bacterium]|nr:glycine--tRNA ligase subunit beta [bacterium]